MIIFKIFGKHSINLCYFIGKPKTEKKINFVGKTYENIQP